MGIYKSYVEEEGKELVFCKCDGCGECEGDGGSTCFGFDTEEELINNLNDSDSWSNIDGKWLCYNCYDTKGC